MSDCCNGMEPAEVTMLGTFDNLLDTLERHSIQAKENCGRLEAMVSDPCPDKVQGESGLSLNGEFGQRLQRMQHLLYSLGDAVMATNIHLHKLA